MAVSRPLAPHEQELVGIVKAAHMNLLTARKLRVTETERRIAEARLKHERAWSAIEAQIRLDIDYEITQHEAADDEALIAAYQAGIPVRRIALDGFGNRLDGAVHAKLRELRADGRIGNITAHHHGAGAPTESELEPVVAFPQPVEVEALLAETAEVREPIYDLLGKPLTLVEPSAPGADDAVTVPAVKITLDERDPYLQTIAGHMRKGTQYEGSYQATFYIHPATGEVTCWESKETGETLWDHAVARYAKDHKDEVDIQVRSLIDSSIIDASI